MQKRKKAFVEMKNIKKVFPGVIANDNISLKINNGEVVSLLGENGAGKTTLMKILYGMHQADAGTIIVEDREVKINSPHRARELGIGMIHQHFTLVPVNTVVENIMLPLKGKYQPENMKKQINNIGKKYGLNVDPEALISDLPVGFQQRVEIIKALIGNSKLLIMDEPTAVLTPQETERLFDFIREYKSEGNSVIFITHKLNEVMEISDRIVVLRDGKKIGSISKNEADKKRLTKMMIGRDFDFGIEKIKSQTGEKILEIENIFLSSEKRGQILNGLSLTIKAGEIFGVAGVSGNGQEELAEAVAGLKKIDQGDILLDGKSIKNCSVQQIINRGVGYIPADRHRVGLVLDMDLEENLILKSTYNRDYYKYLLFNKERLAENAESKIKDFDIKTASTKSSVRSLSGGNQQKAIIAREVSVGKKLLIASQPTRGLDFGAADYVKKTLESEKRNGKAILLFSNELSEIMELSDRIGVIYEGKIMETFAREDAQIDKIGLLMTGVRGEKSGD
ncbi:MULTISPECIES: ABC transporter ATP-binding protein [Halanaerobium]|jgi:simple sugar transport system ATP-binding protein|uniref:Nucleoside ABC transporter ATP-binding protein n=1 Tax=Halanaerobium kushneri TaxID=56779 RepID=A0A1N6Z542_9FIRM|nr:MULTISPECIES: ABC transporter ATP-binding protein [Halanaerobium]RCW62328.1 simple sugar transport system ATP-binding protein [Halanaerobium sp. ST460_2HS_T2]SIR21916.1 nucleoside ABC transporter ATP-binding protein [Halanaerobium kushneri]